MPGRTFSGGTRAAVSVSEMARMCAMSRSRFHDLIRDGVMPQPIYCVRTRRPFFDLRLQAVCLEVRATNTAVDGRYVMFYRERGVTRQAARPRRIAERQEAGSMPRHAALLDGLRALGMTDATESGVDAAVRACFPSGAAGEDQGQVLRSVWQHLRRSNAG